MKFIVNPPTIEDLKALYNSKSYQDLLTEFDKRSQHKLDTREDNGTRLMNMLTNTQRRYIILNIPFDEVCSEFERLKSTMLNFSIISIDFFIKENDDSDGEFPEGEEPREDDKSVTLETFGISRTFLLDMFCEAYLLDKGDKDQLLHYLKTTRMPGAKKYMGQIARLYKQALNA